MSVDFVSPFDQNLIHSVKVQNSTNTMKVFLQRSLAIIEENGNRHKEAISRIASLEVEAAKWRATARTVWRVERPKVANATVAFAEAIGFNHQLLSRVDNVFAKSVSTRLDNDEVFRGYKDVLKEKNDLAAKVECSAEEKEALNTGGRIC